MQHLRLPRFQDTVREAVSDLCFCGYADEISKTSSCLMAQAVCQHLQHHGVQLGNTHWQTDNGTEFLDSKEQPSLPSLVRSFGCDHRFISPQRLTDVPAGSHPSLPFALHSSPILLKITSNLQIVNKAVIQGFVSRIVAETHPVAGFPRKGILAHVHG